MAFYRVDRWLHAFTVVEANTPEEAIRKENNLVDAAITKSVHMRSSTPEVDGIFLCHASLSRMDFNNDNYDRPVGVQEVERGVDGHFRSK
jgi:hypothetical protein